MANKVYFINKIYRLLLGRHHLQHLIYERKFILEKEKNNQILLPYIQTTKEANRCSCIFRFVEGAIEN